MSQEIVYTSAPQGLKPGSKGFCTVVSTNGMAGNISERLEMLSGYRHAFTPGDRNAPVNYSHLHIKVSGKMYYVLSRVGDAGLDYSQRSNKLAHHVALDAAELVAAGPAAVLAHGGFCEAHWDGTVKMLPAGRRSNAPHSGPAVCSHWKSLTGDAGWAGVLAHAATVAKPKPVSVIFPVGTNTLALVVEALNLISPSKRWDVTFSTYFTRAVAGSDCLWRFVLDSTKEASSLRRSPAALVIDLAGNLSAPADTPYLSAARTGKPSTDYSDQFSAPTGAGGDSYSRMRARKIPPVNPVAESEDFGATDLTAGSWDQYRNMPAMPNLPGRRAPWFKRKLTWFLFGLLLLSLVGGLIAAIQYGEQNAPLTADPPVQVPPTDHGGTPIDAGASFGDTRVDEESTGDRTSAQNITPAGGNSDPRKQPEDNNRSTAQGSSLTARKLPIAGLGENRDPNLAAREIDPFAGFVADRLSTGVIPLVPLEGRNRIKKSFPLPDVTLCSLEILAADASVERALDFSEKDPAEGDSKSNPTRVWTAKMRRPDGGRPLDIAMFHVDGKHLIYERTVKASNPRLARFSHSLLKITVHNRSEFFSLREPAYSDARGIRLSEQTRGTPIVFSLGREIDTELADALRFDVSHKSIHGFEWKSRKSGDSFVLAFRSNGEMVVAQEAREKTAERVDTDVLAELRFDIALAETTETTDSTDQSGAVELTVTPSVYLALFDASNSEKFGKQFMAGDTGLISKERAVDWNMETISGQLSMESVKKTIFEPIAKEYNSRVSDGQKLDPQADDFLETLLREVHRYYTKVGEANPNRQKQKTRDMQTLIDVVKGYERTLATLTALTSRIEENRLYVRGYTVIEGQAVDVMVTGANQ